LHKKTDLQLCVEILEYLLRFSKVENLIYPSGISFSSQPQGLKSGVAKFTLTLALSLRERGHELKAPLFLGRGAGGEGSLVRSYTEISLH
jgi:hypothetical protein